MSWIKCEECGAGVNKTAADLKRTQHTFCSKQCSGKWRTREKIAKFWNTVNAVDGGCWEWTGYRNSSGYGFVCVGGKRKSASRHAMQIIRGPIDPALYVLHHCDNRLCVNPDHLYIGDHAQNMADKRNRGRVVIYNKRTKSMQPVPPPREAM